MFLKSLQLQGFKSFPDRVVISFVKGVTAIVGPNGSGKSNISDSVRWVLGEQGSKVLRIKNTEELIFSGTTERKAQGFAEVVLTIDNSDRELNVDADEVSVLRRYYRSGKSEYKINGENVRLQDINELFFDTGLGKNGYSLIGQGKVSAVVEARSEERRLIFEEAAGISKYRSRRTEAERNLKKAEDNMVYLQVVLSGLEEQVGPLEKESEKAKKYLELRSEREEVEIGLWLATLEKSTAALRDLDYNLTLLNSQCADIDRQIEDAENAAGALMEKSSELNAKKDEILRAAAETEEQALRTESQAALLKNDISHNLESINRLEKELEECSVSGEQQKAEIEKKEQQIEDKKNELKALEEQQKQVREKLDTLYSSISGYSKQMEALAARQNELAVKASEAKVNIASAQAQLAELNARGQIIDAGLDQRRERTERLENSKKETNEAIAAAEEKIASLSNSVAGHKMRLDKQRVKLEEIRKEAETLELDVQASERKVKMLEDLEKNLDGFAYGVKKVMEYSRRGVIRGVHGPVSRLIDVDNEYTVAIETALGNVMQNLVVDSEETAKAAINMMKREDAGKATFLPLSTIKPNRLNEPQLKNCEGYIGLGCELVSCDEKYRPIIENVLGKVAIVEDMDVGIAIARRFGHRFKIVTLDGQVFNAGGAITGGSTNAKRSGILSRRNEIEALHTTILGLKQKAQQKRDEQKELAQKASGYEAELLGAQGELSTAQDDVVAFRADLRVIEEQLAAQNRDNENLSAEKKNIAQRCLTLSEQQKVQTELLDQAESEKQRTDEEISGQSEELDALNAQRDEITQELSQIGLKSVAVTTEIEAARASLDEAKARIGTQNERSAAIEKEIAGLKYSNTELAKSADELNAQAQAARVQAEQSRDSVGDILNERMGLEAEMTAKRKLSRELFESKEAVSREAVKCETELSRKQEEYDGIISKLLSEYEMTKREAEEKYEPAQDFRAAQKRTNELRTAMKKLEPVNIAAIEQYKEVNEKYTLYKSQIEDIEKSKAELEKLIEKLTGQMKDLFGEKFTEIAANFSSICKELFGGGSAKLELTDPSDPLETGIEISVAPPGKVINNIDSFSGGEKTIIAVAIYFAIMKVNPSPFCILDEIDSALDETNVINIANYVKRVSDKTQYIIITHRRGTMEAASTMYGVTMQRDGESKVLELNISEIEEKLGL